MFRIPESEIIIETARSGGAGGQHVNKVESKVQLRWNIGLSRVLTYEQKEIVRTQLENRINLDDELMVEAQEERSQKQNREIAFAKLHALVGAALKPTKIRRPTKPNFASRQRRLETKKQTGEKKRMRRMIDED